ncbi:Heme A synthase [Candidatus Methylomirabilis lanthanidiphila]|uniref:Heme A synthase n=1 Tax=Candidatus Methylomirabilis lanthanidiphila TaxID=2211376 RepID=A0A564ZIA6_9BACT|nr:COX15/CtaA family protein [Candidatus Methylomirabilis lanthanidiphila]VUZ85071.1 Heme A synthase [Candidatus Methylomirabilis lanthanidiphila]
MMMDHEKRLINHTRARVCSPWPHRFALSTAAATLLLIFVGGLVTNTGAGLAVPDWPTTFGYNMFLYPWSQMVGGIFYEHSHRLIGSLVGLLTVALACVLWLKEPGGSVRWLGVVAVGAVIIQGVLGGLRVILTPTGSELALIHGLLAQAFFALIVSVVVLTSAEWKQRPGEIMMTDGGAIPRFCLLTTGLVYFQIFFGGMLTHIGDWTVIHLLSAALVTIHVWRLATRILKHYSNHVTLTRPVTLLVGVVGLQLLLGLGSYVNRFTSLDIPFSTVTRLALPTVHRITGALMLGICMVLTLRVYRLLTSRQAVVSQGLLGERVRA